MNPSTAQAAAPANVRLPGLDGVRGLAILLVVAHHWLVFDWPARPGSFFAAVQSALGLSWAGVDLFFVLSGFLIGGILLDQKSSPNYYAAFWARRFFRIAPVFVLFLATFWVFARVGPLWSRSSAPFWIHASFLTNFWIAKHNFWDASYMTLAWTLAVEEQVYLVLPFVVRWCSRAALTRLALATLLIAPALRVIIFLHRPSPVQLASHVLMPCRADAFAIGLLIALWLRRNPRPLGSPERRKLYYLCGATFGAALLILTAAGAGFGTFTMCLAGYSIIAGAAGWLILGAVSVDTPRLQSWLGGSTLRQLGLWSYFIYLFHRLLADVARHGVTALHCPADLQPWLVTGLAAVLTAGAAALSFRFFERPLLAIGHRFKYGTMPAAPFPVPAAPAP